MIIDTSKDNYDELQILAADARASRRRTNLWTTGLIVGGMIAASAYVSTTNDQVDQLAGENKELKRIVNESSFRVQQLESERERLVSEREFYKDSSKLLAQAVPDLRLSEKDPPEPQVTLNVPGTTQPDRAPVSGISNLVWLVDGSRRFPMAKDDLLWIPEAEIWVELENLEGSGKVKVFRGRASPEAQARIDVESTGLPLQITLPTEIGNAKVACLKMHVPSARVGFGEGYADMEILLLQQCPKETPPFEPYSPAP